MATSDASDTFVWVFLPGQSDPVLAGRLQPSSAAEGLAFRYADRYVDRPDAMSLGPDLPLTRTTFSPARGHGMPSSIRDAMPDTWGRHVINRELGFDLDQALPDRRYMLESGSDRVGAIDFQASANDYTARHGGGTLTKIAETAVAVDENEPLGADLDSVIRNTLTAAGGSQPKAFVRLNGRQWLAKFQTDYDRVSPLIRAERAALYIATKAGLDVPESKMVHVEGHGPALLTERFDRSGDARVQVVSGFTVGEEHRLSGASYPNLVERLRRLSPRPADAGTELFRRLAFRIAMRVDDDHMRNVAFYWDGTYATFTPAFDLSPDLASKPTGLTDIGGGSREFSLSALVERHRLYYLSATEAQEIADHMVDMVVAHRSDAADVAEMRPHERDLLLAATATPELIGARSSQM